MLLALLGVGVAALRWRGGVARRSAADGPALDPEDPRRLDADLARVRPVSGGVDTTVLAAFAVGFVSFISPCVLPLVPGYLSAVSGVSLAEIKDGERRTSRILLPAIVFCASFTVVFVALGMTATGLGSVLQDSRGTLDKIAGAVIIALGVFFLLTPFVARLNSEWRPEALISRAGSGGPLVAGAAFAVAWTPCVGPDARLDPHRGVGRRHRRQGRRAARVLLARARRAVPAHRRRLHARDARLPLAARPLPDRHRRLRAPC